MSLYCYIKDESGRAQKAVSYFSYLILTAGAFLLLWAFYPVAAFEIYSQVFISRNIITPLPPEEDAAIKHSFSKEYTPSVFSANVRDLTQAALWFPKATSSKKAQGFSKSADTVTEYYLSIPKLNIEKAHVIIGASDLSKSLIHYQATSLPGERGNVAIFGHSTLPQLYNSRDYKSIFTYLHQLERGDKITVQIGDNEYTYEVGEMFVVKPENISAIAPHFDGSYLTLVTCVPPGSYWNRLVLKARLRTTLSNL